jgi:hypothetical protein
MISTGRFKIPPPKLQRLNGTSICYASEVCTFGITGNLNVQGGLNACVVGDGNEQKLWVETMNCVEIKEIKIFLKNFLRSIC